MSFTTKVYTSQSTDPWFNLSIENWLLRHQDKDTFYLFIWRNEPSIVMGRFQNPWVECDLDLIRKDKVHLVRRQSGGGTVYHDLNNLNFSFICPKSDYDQKRNFEVVINALKSLNVMARVNERNDIVIDFPDGPRKISGSAFKNIKDRSFHHGTILINSDLDLLNKYLHSKREGIESKAIKSVRSSVANIKEINNSIDYQSVVNLLCENFFVTFGGEVDVVSVDQAIINLNGDVKSYYDTILDWDWVFGETPKFKTNLSDTDTVFELHSHKGLIKNILADNVKIPDRFELVKEHLLDKKMTLDEIKKIENILTNDSPHIKILIKLLKDFL